MLIRATSLEAFGIMSLDLLPFFFSTASTTFCFRFSALLILSSVLVL